MDNPPSEHIPQEVLIDLPRLVSTEYRRYFYNGWDAIYAARFKWHDQEFIIPAIKRWRNLLVARGALFKAVRGKKLRSTTIAIHEAGTKTHIRIFCFGTRHDPKHGWMFAGFDEKFLLNMSFLKDEQERHKEQCKGNKFVEPDNRFPRPLLGHVV